MSELLTGGMAAMFKKSGASMMEAIESKAKKDLSSAVSSATGGKLGGGDKAILWSTYNWPSSKHEMLG
jgi:hypothetical protein